MNVHILLIFFWNPDILRIGLKTHINVSKPHMGIGENSFGLNFHRKLIKNFLEKDGSFATTTCNCIEYAEVENIVFPLELDMKRPSFGVIPMDLPPIDMIVEGNLKRFPPFSFELLNLVCYRLSRPTIVRK